MRWSDLLRMSASSLKRRRLRTFLTVLGVVIGTASIVVMISLGLGLQQSMYEEVEQSGGTTSLTVTGQSDYYSSYGYIGVSGMEEEASEKYITDDVVKELKGLEYVESAEPMINIQGLALKGNYEGWLDIYGMTPTALEDLNLELDPGGRLPDPDSPELELVQKGITVLPEKSLASTKSSTGQAAMPHQMGYPMNTVSYWSQLSTVSATSSTSRRDSSACSWDTRLLSSVQFRSSSV